MEKIDVQRHGWGHGANHHSTVEKYMTVFISPDRSLSERAQQRKLVAEVKKMNTEEPNRKHFLKGGKICSVDKTT